MIIYIEITPTSTLGVDPIVNRRIPILEYLLKGELLQEKSKAHQIK